MLELKRVSVGYAGRYWIPNVDITFAPGKIYTILGRNGSGKSGILARCAGRESCGGGTVLLDGQELGGMSLQQISRKIGYLPQEQQPVSMPARKLVGQSLPQKDFLKRKRKVYSCLSALRAAGLGPIAMNQLSRGERCRVYLAALLAQEPEIYLLDDPVSGLDPEYRELVLGLLRDLRAGGKTVVMALQDTELALECSDEIILIDLGREVHTGTPEEIRQKGLLEKVFRPSVLRQMK